MKSYNDFLTESKSKEKTETPKDEYIELGIGDREREIKEPKEPKDEYIELGIGDRKR